MRTSLFWDDTIYRAYGVTAFTTIVGTTLAMIVTCALAYPLSVKTLKYRNGVNFYVYFTMLFHGGLVANYLLISKYLGMKDSIWVLIIPALVSPWNMFLMRNFFKSIDDSIAESAKIDGANDIYILFRIILPISLPAIATVGLFYAIAFWNKWFEAMLYISKEDLFPLQYLIMRIMNNAESPTSCHRRSIFRITWFQRIQRDWLQRSSRSGQSSSSTRFCRNISSKA